MNVITLFLTELFYFIFDMALVLVFAPIRLLGFAIKHIGLLGVFGLFYYFT